MQVNAVETTLIVDLRMRVSSTVYVDRYNTLMSRHKPRLVLRSGNAGNGNLNPWSKHPSTFVWPGLNHFI
jgi:hypothetical protein